MIDAAHSTASSSKIPDLKTMIDDGQRERFIRSIFQQDEAYYSVVIGALNGMATWRDASLYLQTFYQSRGIDPSVQDVVEFTDVIHHRYSSAEQP